MLGTGQAHSGGRGSASPTVRGGVSATMPTIVTPARLRRLARSGLNKRGPQGAGLSPSGKESTDASSCPAADWGMKKTSVTVSRPSARRMAGSGKTRALGMEPPGLGGRTTAAISGNGAASERRHTMIAGTRHPGGPRGMHASSSLQLRQGPSDRCRHDIRADGGPLFAHLVDSTQGPPLCRLLSVKRLMRGVQVPATGGAGRKDRPARSGSAAPSPASARRSPCAPLSARVPIRRRSSGSRDCRSGPATGGRDRAGTRGWTPKVPYRAGARLGRDGRMGGLHSLKAVASRGPGNEPRRCSSCGAA